MPRPQRAPFARRALLGSLPLSALLLHCAAEPPAPEKREQVRSGIAVTLSDCQASSLVSALTMAAVPGTHTITLKAGCTYSLTAPNNWWYGPNALPPISSNVTIEGNGAIIERASTAPKMRLLFVAGPPTPTPAVGDPWGLARGTLTLRNATLRGGLAAAAAAAATATAPGALAAAAAA